MSELPIKIIKDNKDVLNVEKKTEGITTENSASGPAISDVAASSDVAEDNALSKTTGKLIDSNNDVERDSKKLNEEMVAAILDLKLKISTLISNIRDTKTLSDKYDNENQYLQDYVGSLMKSGEIK